MSIEFSHAYSSESLALDIQIKAEETNLDFVLFGGESAASLGLIFTYKDIVGWGCIVSG